MKILQMKSFRHFSSIIITALLGLSRLLFSELNNRLFENGCSDGTEVVGTKYFINNVYRIIYNLFAPFVNQ